jgi:hypothetical protein
MHFKVLFDFDGAKEKWVIIDADHNMTSFSFFFAVLWMTIPDHSLIRNLREGRGLKVRDYEEHDLKVQENDDQFQGQDPGLF